MEANEEEHVRRFFLFYLNYNTGKAYPGWGLRKAERNEWRERPTIITVWQLLLIWLIIYRLSIEMHVL